MVSKDLFEVFCSNRNIKSSTIKSYRAAILKYESFHKMTMEDLIDEAIRDEESMVPLKNRHIKKRLLDFRAFLLDSDLSINTVRTYFSRVKTFYRHFEIELPYLDIKLLFFSFPAADVLRLKRFRWLLGILLGQLMIIMMEVL